MSKDTISVKMNVYDIPIVVEQLKKLEIENKQLKEQKKEAIEYIDKRMDETEDEELQWVEMGIIDYWKELNDLRKILGDKENEDIKK